ncbi:MAG TPA: HD domain-containing protein [Bacillota bacterium]|nr:HD domain-containing protein [Bacillota bacterium]
MKQSIKVNELYELLIIYGEDILASEGMKKSAGFVQHGGVSTYDHSVAVALCSLKMALRLSSALGLNVNLRSLVRGALLHDYFLYDWHDPSRTPRFHGYTHPKTALLNAERDFCLNNIERDIIKKHMFPLTPIPPRYIESFIVMVADKICATRETIAERFLTKLKPKGNHNGLY